MVLCNHFLMISLRARNETVIKWLLWFISQLLWLHECVKWTIYFSYRNFAYSVFKGSLHVLKPQDSDWSYTCPSKGIPTIITKKLADLSSHRFPIDFECTWVINVHKCTWKWMIRVECARGFRSRLNVPWTEISSRSYFCTTGCERQMKKHW